MGSDKGKRPSGPDSQEERPAGPAPDSPWARRMAHQQGPGGYGSMRVRETAVMPFAVYADEDYPAQVEGILGHVFRVLRDLDEQQVDIMILRDDTRAALARLKAA